MKTKPDIGEKKPKTVLNVLLISSSNDFDNMCIRNRLFKS